MPILYKVLKPKRFQVQTVRLEIAIALNRVAKEMLADFAKTTATWEHKPVFEVITQLSPPTIFVGTDDEIYRYVDEGTKPHIILPRRARALRFKSSYSPKTRPGVLASFAGGSSGKDVFSKGVIHPGSAARNFDVEVRKKWEKLFKRRMEKALALGIKKSGHAL